jgi:hypothetical protein
MSAARVSAYLVKKGYTLIGAGHYSSVYAHPENKDICVKVCMELDGWPEYIRWATQNGYAGVYAPLV